MDKFNVLNITNDLNSLEVDMSNWSSLPYDFRVRSDEECVSRYGINNTQLYNILKAAIIDNKPIENENMLGQFVSESSIMMNQNNIIPEFDFLSDEDQTFVWKKQMCEQLEKSPHIVIISPFRGNADEYDIEQLKEKYLKYTLLTDDNRMYSNYYSESIWGYDVPNMYEIMKRKIMSDNHKVEDSGITITMESASSPLTPVHNLAYKYICENDKVGLINIQLDSCAQMSLKEKAVYDIDILPAIKANIDSNNFEKILPKIVPYFTQTEMDNMGRSFDCLSNEEFSKKLFSLSKHIGIGCQLGPDSEIGQECLNIGWGPGIPVNEKAMKFARQRQSKWLAAKAPTIIDITNLKSESSIIVESTQRMRDMYKEKNLYPVYIVLSYTETFFGKAIRFVKNSTYSHAGICLDSNLSKITTYKFDLGIDGGVNVESIDDYIRKTDKAIVKVLCMFVDKATREKLEKSINYYLKNKDKTAYSFKNIFNILINKAVPNDPENLRLVCSQFVDTVLKLANIDITDKPSNLVSPGDFEMINSNPKIYKVFEGFAKDYKDRNVEQTISILFKSYNLNTLKYSKVMQMVSERYIEGYFSIVEDNDKANYYLSNARQLLTPEAVIFERKLPIRVNNSGDVTIELYKSLEDQYQEAHRLLKGYDKTNLPGIKHELARLYYLNSVIEKKIKKIEKADDKYTKLVNLRSRILNDFTKYFKIVSEQEPNFDFADYYSKSEYYNGAITIDNSTLKFTGKVIKSFLKSLGM